MSNFQPHNVSQWSLAQLESLEPEQLFSLTRQAHATTTVSRLLLGRCLLAIDRRDLASPEGYSSPIHYLGFLGTDGREGTEMRRIARQLESLPHLRAAAEQGRIGWSTLREIVRKATPETDARWLELARNHSYRGIERIVRRTHYGESPDDRHLDDREPVEAELRATLPIEVMELWSLAVRALCHRAERRLTMVEIFARASAEILTGNAYPGEDAIESLYAEARKNIAARAEADEREESSTPARVQDAPWAAVAATEEQCPTDPGLQVVRPDAPHWQNDRLRFSGEGRNPTTAQRDEVLRRDAYRCACPGCTNHQWLEVHHVVFYCLGGVTLPANLITLCSKCHRNLHLGYLRVTGTAPDGLHWTDRHGRPLGSSADAEWLGLVEPPDE